MKYMDEFRDPVLARQLLKRIGQLADDLCAVRDTPLQIMEVCGGHTHAIFRYGLQDLLPDGIELVHGPGCPVCVLPMGRVDDCIALAQRPEVILTTFGDAVRVPGSQGTLMDARARGADVRIVYSPADALQLAREHPDREVVFFALGFETTMPATALTVLEARREGIANFSLFCNHITVIATMQAILDSADLRLDGFIGPGHVSMVIGEAPYGFIARDYHKPLVIAGFEPLDVLQALQMLLQQLADGRCEVENQYARVVAGRGNDAAQAAIGQVYQPRDHFEWRGLGSIDASGVCLKPEFRQFDAEQRFAVPGVKVADPEACQCGDVLKGLIKPRQCQQFGRACTPETPLGALMVSSEGSCAAYYRFGGATSAAPIPTTNL